MSQRFLVGTRKGIFDYRRVGSSWKIERVSFLGDPVSMVLPDPRDGSIYAGLPLGHFGVKLRRSTDDGATWTDCAVPTYPAPAEPTDKPPKLDYIWSLENKRSKQPGTLWCGTVPGGLFFSEDAGASWQLVESLWNHEGRKQWFGGGMNQPGIHSICVDPRNEDHVHLGVSCGGVWRTTDGGATWACKATGMRAEYMPPDLASNPNIQDGHRLVQCRAQPNVFWTQHHNGIFRSTDNSETWHEITSQAPSRFGFAVVVHPEHAERAWFVPAKKDECRVPVDGKFITMRTRDGGQSFEVFDKGLPTLPAYDIVYRHGLDIDDTGKTLVMGSTTGGLWTSDDQGESWHMLSEHLPQILCVRFAP